MKKLLILLVTLSAFACGDGSKQNEENSQSGTSTEEQTPTTTDETMSPDTTSQMNESDTTMTEGGGAVQP